jgi:hypothetical protein
MGDVQHARRKLETHTKIQSENLKAIGHLGDLGVNGRISFKFKVDRKEIGRGLYSGLKYGSNCGHGNKPSRSIKGKDFLG